MKCVLYLSPSPVLLYVPVDIRNNLTKSQHVPDSKSQYTYRIQPNKHTVCSKKHWAMETCQGICSNKRTQFFFL